MSVFDDRKNAFEEKFRHEQELRFKITARSNRLFGDWAAGRLGLSGREAADYAMAVVHAQFADGGVVGWVETDFRMRGVAITDAEIRSIQARFATQAREQVMSE